MFLRRVCPKGIPSSSAPVRSLTLLSCLLLLFTVPAFADSTEPISVADADVKIIGEDKYDLSGFWSSSAGDVNGDGHADILVGAPYADKRGKVYLIFGSDDLPAEIRLEDPPADTVVCLEAAKGDKRLGACVTPLGDFNNDGMDDFAVSAYESSYKKRWKAGKVYVIYGSDGFGDTIELDSLTDADGIVIGGPTKYDRLARVISGGGDFNDDGIPDLLMGARSAGSSTGICYLLFGADDHPAEIDLADGLDDIGIAFIGEKKGDDAGYCNDFIGDFNCDDIDDIIITSEHSDPGGLSSAGKAYIVFGSTTLDGDQELSDLTDTIDGIVIEGGNAGDGLGHSCAGGLDINNDGNPDVLIGADDADRFGLDKVGEVYVLYGCNSDNDNTTIVATDIADPDGFKIRGVGQNDQFGNSLDGLPDVNADLITDFIIGTDGANPDGLIDAGQAVVFYGGQDFPDCIEASDYDDYGQVYNGANSGDFAGQSVRAAGDVNDDGGNDFLISGHRTDGDAGCCCSGKVTELTLLYSGSDTNVEVEQMNGDIVFSADVVDGEEFSFSGSDSNGTFGNKLWIFVGTREYGLSTSCSKPIFIGKEFGPFEIVDGESRFNGTLCSIGKDADDDDDDYDDICDAKKNKDVGVTCLFYGDPLPPPQDLECEAVGTSITIEWTNPAEYDEIQVFDNGVLVATLAGDAVEYAPARISAGTHVFGLVGVLNDHTSETAECTINVMVLPVTDLECFTDGTDIHIDWTNGQSYSTSIEILLDGDIFATIDGGDTSFDTPALDPGTYEFCVRGVNGSDASTETCCEVIVPEPVVNLECESEGRTVTISWDNGELYDEVKVYRDGDLIVTLPGTTETFTELAVPAGIHTYAVVGCIGDNSSAQTTCEVVVIEAPENVTCKVECIDDEIVSTLEWTNPDDFDELVISRDGLEIATIDGAETSYSEVGLDPGSYVYGVASKKNGAMSESVECEILVLVPIKLFECEAVADDIFLTWTNGQIYDSIEIYCNGELQETLGGNDKNFTHLDQPAGVYEYELLAFGPDTEACGVTCTIEVLDPPFDVDCTASGSEITILWSNGSTYDSIEIRRDGALVTTLDGDATSYVDTVDPGTYNYEIVGVGENTVSAAGTCEVIDPGAPFGLECSALDSTITATWTNGDTYDEVLVYLNGDLEQTLDGDAESTTIDVDETGSYEVCITGIIDGGESNPACCNVNVINPPTDFMCEAVGDVVFLTWTNDETYATIEIYRDGDLIDTIPGSLEIYVDSGVPAGDHTYEITPFLGGGTTTAVDCDVRVLEPISDLECSSEAGTATITWSNGETYDDIEIRRNGLLIATLPGTDTSYTDTGLAAGLYTYEITGILGDSVTDTVECDVRVPLQPTNLTCTLEDGTTVSLNWTNGEAGDVEVYRDDVLLTTLEAGRSMYVDTPPGPGTYEYCLINVIDGNTSAPTCCEVTVPDPPTNFECVADCDGVTLTWSNNDDYDSVLIERNNMFLAAVPGDQETFFDADVESGSYTYTIIGFIDGFESEEVDCDVTVPEAPSDFDCLLNFTSVELTWDIPALGYGEIQIKRNGTLVATLDGDETSYIDTGISAGTYVYEINGIIDDDCSPTTECTIVVPPSVTDLDCCVEGNDVALTWTVPGDGYDEIEIYRDGDLIATVAGDADSYDDTVSGPGAHTYTLIGIIDGSPSIPAECDIFIQTAISDVMCMRGTETCVNNDVSLEWVNNDNYDAIEIYRDGALLATVPGDSQSFIDTTPCFPGDLPTYMLVSVLTGSLCGEQESDECEVDEPCEFEFIRGDANHDMIVNIADVVYNIKYLFLNLVSVPLCKDAADANDDGQIDIADSIFLVKYLFQGGSEPPAPFPDKDLDNTCDELDCDG